MRRVIAVALLSVLLVTAAAIYSVREITHRQTHAASNAAHVATVVATKRANKAVKTATKAAAKTAAKKVKTAQEKFNDELVKSQITACRRGNILRRTVNSDTLVIQQFMRLAASQYAKVKTPFAQRRAADYRAGADRLRLVPLPNCGSVIVRPTAGRKPTGRGKQ